MIPKAGILATATEKALLPTTVEKDYALGWILFGISQHPEASQWVFKGGTCLKKCFFETYRFSEDLDFTIPQDCTYEYESILNSLREIVQWVEAESGMVFPEERIDLEEYINPRGHVSFQGKVAFSGPLGMARKALQRVKFDITQDEIIVDRSVLMDVNHPYEDFETSGSQVLCYSVNEILAEKSRALYERQGRARDVYDVIHISRSFRDMVDRSVAKHALEEKFKFKNLPYPDSSIILDRIDKGILKANWEHQLGHQLPILPDVDQFIGDLPEALSWWIDESWNAQPIQEITDSFREEIIQRNNFRYIGHHKESASGLALVTPGSILFERIVYAGRNHLCLRVVYKDAIRIVEPYSLRGPSTGNILLYVRERTRNGVPIGNIKSYKLHGIQEVSVTSQSFEPRYRMEL